MKFKSVISLVELPLRAKKINSDEIANIFGGCVGENASCDHSACCDDYICTSHFAGPWHCEKKSTDDGI
jgi:hypothetical protein